ncbi:hypothetical protein GJ744_008247 [Endocarpon pusillum]|uniref:Uncharacterized protein n=1 Tax=Endocarpon pusillum TaxID=364733 RepID=A0A8H7E4L5_9EURO|nr:hypothetical protein GJ744_008247 [Endocarpon pusillum]
MPVRHLPEEILILIYEELGRRRDFPTLFGCALSSVSFSEPALRTMYRINEQSPLITETDELDQQESQLRKWALLWRSIIRSSLSATYKPYCLYIRSLNLDNLKDLLQEARFSGKIEQDFFAGELQDFHFRTEQISTQPTKKRQKIRLVVDFMPILHAVGEAITKKTMLLQELRGPISKEFLPQWIRRLPRLQVLHLQQGHVLTAEAQNAIRENCPSFRSLELYAWTEAKADEHLAALLSTTSGWQNFELYSGSDIGRMSLAAMNYHASTLSSIKLMGLNDDAVRSLGCLKECTALQKLELEARSFVELEDLENDAFLDIVAWLNNCCDLKELALKNFRDGPAILAETLATRKFTLTSLSLKKYIASGDKAVAFHAAISEQLSLQKVYLNGDGEETTYEELQMLVNALSRLSSLQVLDLNQMSDNFTDHHITTLALNLPRLETFYPSGYAITDSVFPALAGLKHLRDLQFCGVTHFTATGIGAFISTLDRTTNSGLFLSLWAVDRDHMLSSDEEAFMRELINTRLDGRFWVTTWGEADSDFESESD